MGQFYTNGEGVTTNKTKAVEWFQKAAEQGHVQAQLELAIHYDLGAGVPENPTKAAEWFQKAAKNGNSTASNHFRTFLLSRQRSA